MDEDLATIPGSSSCGRLRVCVIVLGDVGRSPRMQYHAQSLLEDVPERTIHVDVVGYGDSPLIDALRSRVATTVAGSDEDEDEDATLNVHYLPNAKGGGGGLIVRTLRRSLSLLYVLLFRIEWGVTHVMVQNPPAIPTLPIVWLVCRLRGAAFVIDWHNYGHTIMRLQRPSGGVVLRCAEWIERTFGAYGDRHLCVTDAMRRDLIRQWGLPPARIRAFHDRPAAMYRPSSASQKTELLRRLSEGDDETGAAFRRAFEMTRSGGSLKILVSSTSWTPDEDFGLLFRALEQYDRSDDATPLLCVITGKGPQRAYYERRMREKPFRRVVVATAWLTFDDYVTLIGSADVGVSLHTSSSGLDLPMKVIDMFGCQLPVCAIDFSCLRELVRHGENGLVFADSDQLATQLIRLLATEEGTRELAAYRKNLRSFREDGWKTRWKRIVRPLFAGR